MEISDFISNLKKLGAAESVSGVIYRIDTVNDKYVVGTRLSTLKEFKIETYGLYNAYNDIIAYSIARLCQPHSIPGTCNHNVSSQNVIDYGL